MSASKEKRPRKRPSSTRRTSPKSAASAYVASPHGSANAIARAHYHREKARRADRTRPADHPLEQARRAYQELLAKDAERARGGRPKKISTVKGKAAKQ
jgi:hypothetical protein